MGPVRNYVIDEVARWWREASNESRFKLMRRVREEAPKELTLEELQLAATQAELCEGEVEGDEAAAAGQRVRSGKGLHG